MATVGGVVIDSNSGRLTLSSWRCFFEFLNHGCGADLQDPSGISNATPVDGHIHDLLFHLGQVSPVAVVQDKGGARTLGVTAAIALFAFSTLTIFDPIGGVTAGATDGFEAIGKTKDRRSHLFCLLHRSRTLPFSAPLRRETPKSFLHYQALISIVATAKNFSIAYFDLSEKPVSADGLV